MSTLAKNPSQPKTIASQLVHAPLKSGINTKPARTTCVHKITFPLVKPFGWFIYANLKILMVTPITHGMNP